MMQSHTYWEECWKCASILLLFFFSSRRRHTRSDRDWSSDVCSSDLSKTPRNNAQTPAKPPSHPAKPPSHHALPRTFPLLHHPCPSSPHFPLNPSQPRPDRKSVV